MTNLILYGASDDLIELDGDLSEEFNPDAGNETYIGFSDGSLVAARYDAKGNWRFTIVEESSGTSITVHPIGTVKERRGVEIPDYSEMVNIDAMDTITWALCGKDKPVRPKKGVKPVLDDGVLANEHLALKREK